MFNITGADEVGILEKGKDVSEVDLVGPGLGQPCHRKIDGIENQCGT